MKLENRVAIITGGARGIGKEIAKLYAVEGAKCVIADVLSKEGNETAESINSTQGDVCRYVHCDVTDMRSVSELVSFAVNTFGRIDILVNNAGVAQLSPLVMSDISRAKRLIEVNLLGPYIVTQAVVRQMLKQKPYQNIATDTAAAPAYGTGIPLRGVVINASSVSAKYGSHGMSAYVASKAGVNGLTKTWARELASHGIRVCAVAPGLTSTDMVSGFPRDRLQHLVDAVPLRRFATSNDIAKAYLFLATDDAQYITGTVLDVNGGYVIGTSKL
mmetsp:Transcript_38180/g.61813  ORF Transcript_38180/g.61813 Transcript_38180/m.61813 type:complete len:274 (-) Transcript_38180:331-1152(-)